MIEYKITDSPATSREQDRGHGTYILHSEHTRHTKFLKPKRPTAISTMSITSRKQARQQNNKNMVWRSNNDQLLDWDKFSKIQSNDRI
jgi:hypothetical protein